MLQFVVAAVLCLVPAEDLDLLDAIPSSAPFVLHVESVERLHDVAEQNAWGRFFSDPEAAAFLRVIVNEMYDLDGIADDPDRMLPFHVLDAVSGGVSFHLDLDEGRETACRILMIEPGGDRIAFDKHLETHRAALFDCEAYSDSVESYRGEEILRFHPLDEESDTSCLMLCDTGAVVVAGASGRSEFLLEAIQGIIDRLKKGPPEHGPSCSEQFHHCRKGGRVGMVEIFADCRVIGDLAAKILAEGEEGDDQAFWDDFVRLSGIRDLSTLFATVDIGEGEEFTCSLSLGVGGDGAIRKVLDCFDGPWPQELYSLFPADAAFAVAMQFDVNRLYSEFMALLKDWDESFHAAYREMYDRNIKQGRGIDPEKELLPLFDGRYAFFSVARSGAGNEEPKASGALVLGLRDATLFEKRLEKMFSLNSRFRETETEEFQGHTIRTIPARSGEGDVVRTYGPDFFAFGFRPAIRSVIRIMNDSDQPNLRDQEIYAGLVGKSARAGAICTVNTGAYFKYVLNFMRNRLSRRAGVNFRLPRDASVDTYFNGAIAFLLTVDEVGLHLEIAGS